ncbi:response regulator [Salarchaeum sp. JOR-1]|uniref:response regulator n=1 Tax=Salarchaeum sp. JOR-1 TaxID=2599399 RepID=UPI001F10228B|nr:response regulator [Salarchaeum sp. JOR-1]
MSRNTVVVVEDERSVRDLYTAWLADAYDVRTADTLADARDALDDTVDAVLLDRNLPDGTGDDLLETIAERDLTCRVAMVTGVEPDIDVISLGFDDYLVKPVERDVLVETVERLVDLHDYPGAVRAYYQMAAAKASLEEAKSPTELARDERYRELCGEFEALQERVGPTAGTTNPNVVRVLFRGLA